MTKLEPTATVAVMAGEIMLKNGGETRRVEETMERMAYACGAASAESFVIPTGVFLTVGDADGHSLTVIRRVRERTINLDRISKVNDLSRKLERQQMDIRQAQAVLERIAKERTGFSLLPSIAASGMIGATAAVLQHGGWPEVGAAFLAASLVRYEAHVLSRLHSPSVALEFIGGASVALWGMSLQAQWPQLQESIIIISGIMPLVPGMVMTNALRDFIIGDLVSGISRAMEALLVAAAIAMGAFLIVSSSVWS